MPRTARASVTHTWYHALNRGNRREAVFHTAADYDAFVQAIADAHARLPVDILGYCLMPNHFHLILRTHTDGDLGRWILWLLMAHARRYHRHYHTSGHVWQGRFKSQALLDDAAILACSVYVDLNPIRAGVAETPEQSEYTSGCDQAQSLPTTKLSATASRQPLSVLLPAHLPIGGCWPVASPRRDSWLCELTLQALS